MSEENQAQNENVSDQNVEASPATEEPKEDSTTSKVDEPKQEAKPEEIKEPRQTRSEKRIKQLLEEKKALKEEVEKLGTPKETTRLPWEQDKPLIDPNEEFIDPQKLETRIQERIQAEVARTLSQQKQLESYKGKVSEHERGLQEVLEKHPELDDQSDKYDPELATEFIERYQDANYLPDGSFYPKRSPQEIADRLLSRQEKLVVKKTSEITGKLVKQAAESAVSPRNNEPENENYKMENLYQRAIETGSDQDWTAYFKALNSAK